jgi:hypothetical protein
MGQDDSHGYDDRAGGTIPALPPEQPENRITRWLLLDGNRLLIVAGVSILVFVGYVVLGLVNVIGVSDLSLMSSMFSASITGVFTLVTITTSINQLVLSRILGSPEYIQDRMDSARAFREDVADLSERRTVSPSDHGDFMEFIAAIAGEHSDRIDELFQTDAGDPVDENMGKLAQKFRVIQREIQQIRPEEPDLFRMLSPIINNSFSQYRHMLRYVDENVDDLTTEQVALLDELIDILREIDRTRHYFKTLYLHQSLATVSRWMLLTGLPALLVAYVGTLAYDGIVAALGELELLIVTSATLVLVFCPLVILVSYSLRITTIAKRTTTFGSFTPEEEMP